MSKSSLKAHLIFPVSRTKKLLKCDVWDVKRVSTSSAVYAAAVAEYVCREMLYDIGDLAKKKKVRRITVDHIKSTVMATHEYRRLFGGDLLDTNASEPSLQSLLFKEFILKDKSTSKTTVKPKKKIEKPLPKKAKVKKTSHKGNAIAPALFEETTTQPESTTPSSKQVETYSEDINDVLSQIFDAEEGEQAEEVKPKIKIPKKKTSKKRKNKDVIEEKDKENDKKDGAGEVLEPKGDSDIQKKFDDASHVKNSSPSAANGLGKKRKTSSLLPSEESNSNQTDNEDE